MSDEPMTQTELKRRHDKYWAETPYHPDPPLWIQALINKTYEIVNSNVSSSDDPHGLTR